MDITKRYLQMRQLSAEKNVRFRLALDACSADAAASAPAIFAAGKAGRDAESELESEPESDSVSESEFELDSSESESESESEPESEPEFDASSAPNCACSGNCGSSWGNRFCCDTVRRSVDGLSSDSLVNGPDAFRRGCADESTEGGRSSASTNTDDDDRRGVLSIGAFGRIAGPCTRLGEASACDSGWERNDWLSLASSSIAATSHKDARGALTISLLDAAFNVLSKPL